MGGYSIFGPAAATQDGEMTLRADTN